MFKSHYCVPLSIHCLLVVAAGLLLCLRSVAAGEELRPGHDAANRQFRERLVAAQGDLDRLDAALDADILAFQPLIEEALVYRQQLTALARELHAKIQADQPLTGADLDTLNRQIQTGVAIAKRLFVVIDVHANWQTVSDPELREVGLAALPVPLRTKGTMLSLAGSLFLYDTYRLHLAVLADNEKVRRVFNRGDSGYANSRHLLDSLTGEFLSAGSRTRVRDELRACEQNQFATAAAYGGGPTLRYLQELIAQSPSRALAQPGSLPTSSSVAEHAASHATRAGDSLLQLGDSSMNTLSLFFGNTVGLVEMRKGKLWDQADIAALVRKTLKPGDILLEKTPFRLTDSFIPGHWGHAAIWVGCEAELRQLDLWNDPAIKPHQEELRRGAGIVEALRSGVTLNSVEHFLNIDDLAILRAPALTPEQLKHHLQLALRQLGKAYDFNFDVEATDKIVCSELIYVVYTEISWPTSRTLGRYTISPDNVAAKALNNGPLQLVLLYHDGRRIEQQPLERMAELMNAGKINGWSVPGLPALSLKPLLKQK